MTAAPTPLHPPSLGALLRAAEATGLTDDEIKHEIDVHFPRVWEPGWFASPQSDGRRLHAVDLGRVGGYQDSLPDMPLPHEIDRSNAAAEARRRAWPELTEPQPVDDGARGGRGR